MENGSFHNTLKCQKIHWANHFNHLWLNCTFPRAHQQQQKHQWEHVFSQCPILQFDFLANKTVFLPFDFQVFLMPSNSICQQMHPRICLSNPTTYILESTNPPLLLLCCVSQSWFSQLCWCDSGEWGNWFIVMTMMTIITMITMLTMTTIYSKDVFQSNSLTERSPRLGLAKTSTAPAAGFQVSRFPGCGEWVFSEWSLSAL